MTLLFSDDIVAYRVFGEDVIRRPKQPGVVEYLIEFYKEDIEGLVVKQTSNISDKTIKHPNGWILTQTTDENGNLVAVTFQDEEHVIKQVLWEVG